MFNEITKLIVALFRHEYDVEISYRAYIASHTVHKFKPNEDETVLLPMMKAINSIPTKRFPSHPQNQSPIYTQSAIFLLIQEQGPAQILLLLSHRKETPSPHSQNQQPESPSHSPQPPPYKQYPYTPRSDPHLHLVSSQTPRAHISHRCQGGSARIRCSRVRGGRMVLWCLDCWVCGGLLCWGRDLLVDWRGGRMYVVGV